MRTTDIALLIKAHDYRGQTFEEGVYSVLNQLGMRDDQAAHFYAVLVERCPKGKATPTGELESVLNAARRTAPQ